MTRLKLFTLPNLVTVANLACGFIGCVLVFQDQIKYPRHMEYACYCIYLAATFDFLDGFVARLFHASSELGKQLDSLCDVVSFGVLPGFMLYHMLVEFKWAAILVPILSALRLAKFNLDTRQAESFVGVPTPMNALFVSSLAFILNDKVDTPDVNFMLVGLTIISAVMLVVELPLLSLKFKNYGLRGNEIRYLLVIVSLGLFLFLQLESFVIIYFLYILLSIVNNSLKKSKNEILS